MRVIVNGLPCFGSKTGVGHYTSQLLRCLQAQCDSEDAVDLFPQGVVGKLYGLKALLQKRLQPPRPSTIPSTPPTATQVPPGPPDSGLLSRVRSLGSWVLDRHFRSLCASRQYDLYHEPNFLPFPSDLPTVVTIHDLSVLSHPEWHPANRVARYTEDFERGLRQCTHLVTVSEFIRQEIIHTLNWSPDRVTVTPNGVRPDLGPLPSSMVNRELRRLGLPPRYLLYLGTLEPRKNLLMLLRAYTSLPLETRTAFPLLLVGNWGWNTADLADYYDKEARHRGVLHLGYVADEHLATLYNGARALVFPSFYEGFGLPPVEMLACGGAVLASTAGALAETLGQQALLLDPHDQDAWRKALLRVTQDDEWWHSLRNDAVRTAAPYTWENCAAKTRAVYRQVMGLKPTSFTARQAG